MQSTAHALFWPPEGSVDIVVRATRWKATPEQAVWVPAETPFRIASSHNDHLFRIALPVRAVNSAELPTQPRLVPADQTLRAHIVTYISCRFRGAPVDFSGLVSCLSNTAQLTVALQRPQDALAAELAAELEASPGASFSLEAWAQAQQVNPRTLLRRFRAESGRSVSEYRLAARMQHALGLLRSGASLDETAAQTGYTSAAGFLAAFRRMFGAAPADYGLTQR